MLQYFQNDYCGVCILEVVDRVIFSMCITVCNFFSSSACVVSKDHSGSLRICSSCVCPRSSLLLHLISLSSLHLSASHPGSLLPSTILNISVFNNHSSAILPMWPNSWSVFFFSWLFTATVAVFPLRPAIWLPVYVYNITSQMQQPTLIVFLGGPCLCCI